MPTCPNGHQSAAYDWCEVCGHQMPDPQGAAGGPVPPPPPPPPAAGDGYGYPAQPQPSGQYPTGPEHGGQPGGQPGLGGPQPGPPGERCPQCGTQREAQAHFCEECRYNFLTGQPTAYPTPGPPPGGYPQPGAAPLDPTGSGRSEVHRPAEPIPPQTGGAGAETSWNLAPPSTGGPAPQQPQAPQYHQGPPAPQYQSPPEQSYPQGQQPPQQNPYPGQGQPPYQGGSGHYQGGQQYPGAHEQSYTQGQQAPAQHQAPAPQPPAPQPYPQQDQPQYGYPPQQSGAPQQAQQFAPQAPQQGQPQYPYQQQPPYGQQQGQPGGWRVTITQDPEYFHAMMERSGPEGAGLQIPQTGPGQQLPLAGHQVTIGRRRQSTGEAPDIDLGQAPEDPGVSHQHAKLVQQPDGGWAVVDEDSTNGTTLNGAEDPIQPFVPVTLQEGDRIHVGAWTTITLYRG